MYHSGLVLSCVHVQRRDNFLKSFSFYLLLFCAAIKTTIREERENKLVLKRETFVENYFIHVIYVNLV